MKCPTCGKELGTNSFIGSDERSIKEHGECYSCKFWRDRLSLVGKSDIAIIDGTFYSIEREDAPGSRGFGGDRFNIHFKDGRKVTTTNLWCGGDVPEYWKGKFPNNADFDWQWKKIGNCNYLIPKNEKE